MGLLSLVDGQLWRRVGDWNGLKRIISIPILDQLPKFIWWTLQSQKARVRQMSSKEETQSERPKSSRLKLTFRPSEKTSYVRKRPDGCSTTFILLAAAPGYTKYITVVSGTITHLYKILIKRDNECCKIRVELPMGRICTLPDRQLTSLTVWVIYNLHAGHAYELHTNL